ncbi:MAG TPA: N-acetylmuramic acid 6-phosphate etherase [Acidimicrobiales bacterium]|nr:N-acetylmuramic acid 6-phosphate etherase [Acidimicrobiales bacterium]
MSACSPAGRLTFEVGDSLALARSPVIDRLQSYLGSLLAAGFPPALSLAVVGPEGIALEAYGGYACTYGEVIPATAGTLYDLASLTKVVCTTTLVMLGRERGWFGLDDEVGRWLPRYPVAGTTLRHLLTHTAGLADHRSFYRSARGRAEVEAALMGEAANTQPGGEVSYSDLGFMVLGWALEAACGRPLDELFSLDVAAGLGMEHSCFCPPAAQRHMVAATELDGDQRLERGLVWGEVHDGNAHALGGVAGHAGLFAPAGDLARFVRALLPGGPGGLLEPASIDLMRTRQAATGDDVRGLGWRLAPDEWGAWPPGTIWHTGFTGTSLLVSPEAGTAVVLLTNSVHPQRRLDQQASVRTEVHRLVSEAVAGQPGATSAGAPPLWAKERHAVGGLSAGPSTARVSGADALVPGGPLIAVGPAGTSGNEPGLGGLATESVRSELERLDLMAAPELVELLTVDSGRATAAVIRARESIVAAVELAYERLSAGGRLIYVGAGTAGRLAVLDAAELGPTFSVPDGAAVALIAGGDHALRHPVEGAEDDPEAGEVALRELGLTATDVVIGVSASGRTPFVVGALSYARVCGAGTVALTCNSSAPLASVADVAIVTVVGGEVVAGSSRLNAGTAQKITLNTISTAVMVLLGKTYGNLMVDLRATNSKLRDRAARIVEAVAGVPRQEAAASLEAAGWSAKLAALVAASGQDVASAQAALDAARGRLRVALAALGVGRPAPVGGAPVGGAPVAATPAAPARPVFQAYRPGSARRLGVGRAFVGGRLVPGDVEVADGRVSALGLSGGGTAIAAPGFVDLQVNGYAGVDCASASLDDMLAMSLALAGHGVTAYQPTLISGDPGVTAASTAVISEFADQQRERPAAARGARVVGVHLEGPFLSPERPGAHPVEHLRRPDLALVERLVRAGRVTMMTIAPELPGATEVVSWLVARGVVVSLGHSAASVAQVADAVRVGASVATHLFNGMTPISARAPGLAGAALSDRRLKVQLIADGVHVADELVALAFAAAGERCSIVTDATSLSGAPERELVLGDVPISLGDGVARRADGTIAGGASSLLQAVHRLASLALPLDVVLGAATERPARVLGLDEIGRLRVGGPANLVVLDDNLLLREVLLDGTPFAGVPTLPGTTA